jgi:MoaA/NifB/PqqE/SkfB family radical SAM enzyme
MTHNADSLYSTSKIVHHPEVLEKLRNGDTVPPIFVQWFPTNLCNQACEFCSYGHWKGNSQGPPPDQWKNHNLFDDRVYMPQDKMYETIDCLHDMGVKAVEITGGGEPTTYPYFKQLVTGIAMAGMELALVTNGVLLTEDLARRVMRDCNASWVRVSLDAGNAAKYAATRHAPESHFTKACSAIEQLVRFKTHPEARVGVGYVVDRHNWNTVYSGIETAFNCGADNVRLSVAFTPEGNERWNPAHISEAHSQAEAATAKFKRDGFSVSNLIMERWQNTICTFQNYPYCYWKEIGCIIGADGNVYSCCSLAYNKAGLVGDIRNQTFKEFWYSTEAVDWRQSHRPCYNCPVFCLYERRNREALCFTDHPGQGITSCQLVHATSYPNRCVAGRGFRTV